jgi:hypothetical protein
MLISDIRNELARELSLRRTVFPRLISAGRLTQGESDERLDRLEAALKIVDTLISHHVSNVEDLPLRLVPVWSVNTGSLKSTVGSIIKVGV